MGNEIIDWIKELWLEFKGMPSDFKELVNKVNDSEKRRLRNEINKIKEAKKTKVDGLEIIVIKGGNNLFTNLLLLYLCVLNTLVVVGFLSSLIAINNELPVAELRYYFDGFINFASRFDDINGANRFLYFINTFPEMPYDKLGESILEGNFRRDD